MKLRSIAFLFYLLLPAGLFSQVISIDSVSNFFNTQTQFLPQEKIYVQTDRASYLIGDTIWFKAYLVNGKTHIADSKSNFIYGELINSLNEVVERVKIRKNAGVFSGYLEIDQASLSGLYQLRFYTTNMTNIDEAYFFKKNVRIDNYVSSRLKKNIKFKFEDKRVKINFSLYDNLTAKKHRIDRFYIYDAKGDKETFLLENGEVVNLEIPPSKIRGNSVVIGYKSVKFTQKEIVSIPHRDGGFTVSFFPEGGHMLQETATKVAFKAINTSGIGEDITGHIVSSKGDTLLQFLSTHLGMGQFVLNANNDQLYAICRNSLGVEKRFTLPHIEDNLLSLQTIWNGNNLVLGINKSKNYLPTKSLYLLIHCRGEILHSKIWSNQYSYISIERKKLPSGVIHALLLDENLNPISERLVFNKNELDFAKTIFTTQKSKYDCREYVNASVLVSNTEKQPLRGNFSVSVAEHIGADTVSTIYSTLLLTSDLKGYIESPSDYFTPGAKNRYNLDLLMMTQGWRRYNVSKILKQAYEFPLRDIERSQSISGKLKKGFFRDREAVGHPILLFAVDHEQTTTTITDDKGDFKFSNITFSDSTKFIVQGTNAKGGRSVNIEIDTFLFAPKGTLLPFYKKENENAEIKLTNKTESMDKLHSIMQTLHLDEVVVEGWKKPKQENNRHWSSSAFSKITTREDIDNMHSDRLTDILRMTPGVTVHKGALKLNKFASESIDIGESSYGTKILILVDGMEMEYDQLYSIPVSTVESIELLKDPISFILGPKGLYGAIIITTKSGDATSGDTQSENIALISPLGYQITKEFYDPQYDVEEKLEIEKRDERRTIYWNPTIELSEKGESSFHFYTSDVREDYAVIIEGITTDGRIIYNVGNIKVY